MQSKTRHVGLNLLVGLLLSSASRTGVLCEDDSTRDILLVNQDSTDHAIAVEIPDDSGVVYSDGRTIDSGSDLYLTQFTQAGEYGVTVTVDGDSTTIRIPSDSVIVRFVRPVSASTTKMLLMSSNDSLPNNRSVFHSNTIAVSMNTTE